jgi:phosphoribosylformylglycinamidine synthase
MKNDSTMGGVKISVPPTLLVSAIGQIDDVRRAVTLDPKGVSDAVFVLGATRDETGGGEYLRWRGDRDRAPRAPGAPQPWVGNKAPALDPQETLPLYRALEGAIHAGLVRSVAVPARGGLAPALARMAMAARLGLDLDIAGCGEPAALALDALLFSESNGRFVVTTRDADAAAFAERFGGLRCARVGVVTAEPRLVVRCGGRRAIDVAVADLVTAFKSGWAGGQ